MLELSEASRGGLLLVQAITLRRIHPRMPCTNNGTACATSRKRQRQPPSMNFTILGASAISCEPLSRVGANPQFRAFYTGGKAS
eukprot:6176726-Pleurochrysis_carterae.AAC.4